MRQRKTIRFILYLFLTTFAVQGQQTLIRAGRLIDTNQKTVKKNVDILVEGKRIIKVGKNLKSPSATVFDLSDKTVLPGLIDGHTHICLTPDYNSNSPVLYKTNTYRTMEAFKAAKRILMSGFTTIRDVDNEGADMADIAVRDAINEGLFVGPRIFVSGWAISITGGHMNLTGLRPSIDKKVDQLAIIADNPDDMVAAIRDQRKAGVDFIKIYATGTLRHINRKTLEPLSQLNTEEVEIMVNEARRWKMDVAAHAYGGAGAYHAVKGGVHSIEHGLFLDDKILALMVKKGTFWCPTMTVYLPDEGASEADIQFHNRIVAEHKKSFQRAMKKGIKITFGTDIGSMPHGEGWREMDRMVNYGMSPMDVIHSATVMGAKLLRKNDEIGQ
ncbi:amidohydrolase family protein, partial [Caldithrix abyssi]|nr:amidohydrolase family protein [Caldithrix abyssi]